ncbi:MAG: FecCD family ABC transporter permease [Terriglobales bacterium]
MNSNPYNGGSDQRERRGEAPCGRRASVRRPHLWTVYVVSAMALVLACLVALGSGAVPVSWRDIVAVLAGREHGTTMRLIVMQLRLPRVCSAALVGAGLALSGAVLQTLLRNPLAEPFTLGVSGGAGFLVTALAAFVPAAFALPYAAPLAGFLGAALAGGLVFALAHRQHFSNAALILCGVILSFFFGSLIMLNFAFGRPAALQSVMVWLMGDFSVVTPSTVLVTGLGLIAPLVLVFASAQTLDVLAIGDERALGLGVPVRAARRRLFAAAALMTGLCVANAGIIGFVGFLVPHLVRFLVGARHRYVLPLAALLGAAFLVIADTLARVLFSPLELPVGAFTGITGALFFLAYYLRRPRGEWEAEAL